MNKSGVGDIGERLAPRGMLLRASVPTRRVARLARKKPLGAVAALIVLALIAMAALADVVAPYDPLRSDPSAVLAAPSRDHLMGTDNLGRDIFSRLIPWFQNLTRGWHRRRHTRHVSGDGRRPGEWLCWRLVRSSDSADRRRLAGVPDPGLRSDRDCGPRAGSQADDFRHRHWLHTFSKPHCEVISPLPSREGLRRGGSHNRGGEPADRRSPHSAEPDADRHHPLEHQCGRGSAGGGHAELPRRRGPTTCASVGKHVERDRESLFPLRLPGSSYGPECSSASRS